MLTDRPSGEKEGVRIAASRAGQHDGEGHDGGDDDGYGGNGHDPGGGRSVDEARPDRARAVRPPAAAAAPRPRSSAARAKVLRQRRRRRRLLITFTAFTAFCTFVVGVGYVYVQRRLDQIRRIELPALAGDAGSSVMNVLLVGSDSRENVGGRDAMGLGRDEVVGERSDTIMLLHADPREQKAAIVSVPRDLYLPIAGTTQSDRVNTAFALGGPDQLVATLQRALGITIHHYVQVDFVGFKDIVDTVGGVTMYVPYPVRDTLSGLDLGKQGCFVLDGNKALSWVRSRNMEFLVNGTWQTDGRGDLGRIERQQDFIRRMMKKALASGVSNPIQLNRLIGVGVRDVTFDSALSTKDLTALGRRFSSLDPDRVLLRTLPTDPADVDGKSVLRLQRAQAQPLIDVLNGRVPVDGPPPSVPAGPSTTQPPGVKASDVKVQVLNGIGTTGAAAKAGTALAGSGFVVTDKSDAPALAAKTTIAHAPGQQAKAQLVQSSLSTPGVLREDASLRSVDVVLTLGADYTGIKPAVSAGTAGATSTTVAPTTTVPQINPVPLPPGAAVPPC